MDDYEAYVRAQAEKAEALPAVRRGRPSKTDPVVIDGVTVLTGDERKRLTELVSGIQSDTDKIQRLMITTASRYYQMGEILSECAMRVKGLPTLAKIASSTGIKELMISKAIRIYRHFKSNPEMLNNLSMWDVMRIVAPPKDTGDEKKAHAPPAVLPGQLEFGSDSFGLAPLSGVSLTNYRITDGGAGKLYMIKKGINIPVPVSQITINPPDKDDEVMTGAYGELMSEIQCALERYFSVVELVEQQQGGTHGN